ncbi:MAG: response regulator [Steroidobacteraceae bacterium]|nr:response regulator [Steroidobacteraceae bacterium]
MKFDARRALHESEERFRALATATSDVIYRMNPDWTEMRHLEGREFIVNTLAPEKHWMERYIHPDDREDVKAAIAASIRDKKLFELEHRVVRVDGTLGWTHSRAVPMISPEGDILEWIGMASDVTARRQAQETLLTQRRLYEAILTNTPDLAYVWGRDHRFLYANEGLLKMWGRTWDEAIGKNCLELGYEPWHAEMHDREIDQVAATKLPVRGQVPFNGTFGPRMYDYVLVPVFGENGDVVAIAGTTRDVTDLKQLESSLREADRRKDEFLATLAHELRNPLAPIRNAVHFMKLHKLPDEELNGAREIIDRQVQHMVRLVEDLLDVSRITLGQVTLRSDRLTLRRALEDALDAIAPAALAAGHELDVKLPPPEIEIAGDATRISQIFQNLLDNAIKYTPQGGQIVLRAERVEGHVRVSVRDSGIGIPAERQARIFDLFTRVHPNEGIKTSGLGIGLSLARQLVELHGGRIEVASEGADRGSEFTVYLPAAPPRDAVEPAPAPKAPMDGGTRRVLVVDDNRDAADSLAMILEMSGTEVAVAYDGAQALVLLEEEEPDVVLMDIGMPGMDGYEVARRIRSTPGGDRFHLVALTGWGQADDKERALATGFDEHITKPVDPAVLAELLASNGRRASP